MTQPKSGKPRKRTSSESTKKAPRSRTVKVFRAIALTIDIIIALATIISAYAGWLSPLKYGGIWGIAGLTFPIWFWLTIVLLIIQLFKHRRGAIVLAATLLLSAGPVLSYFPVHIFPTKANPVSHTFTILSYNVANLWERSEDPNVTKNRIISFLLEKDADIVCLQEAEHLGISETLKITKEQYDSLTSRYPHIIHQGKSQVTLSKYPLEPIHASVRGNGFDGGDLGICRITLPGEQKFTLFNIHLQSYNLKNDDRQVYLDITELKSADIRNIRSHLLSKLSAANIKRAKQVRQLMRFIRLYGGPDAIICGDFNDVSNSHAIHTLNEAGFSEVYPRVGFGPIITFHENRFYFCIDHILSRGDLKPLSLTKSRVDYSDHYPLLTTFEVQGRKLTEE